jgi:hypothetical protein
MKGKLLHNYPLKFNPNKKELIDYSMTQLKISPRSFADLGGVWGIDGAYTFYTLDTYNNVTGRLVDTHFTGEVEKKSNSYNRLELIKLNFGESIALEFIGQTDMIFLFDVLLHQVAPNWDEILEMYSNITNCFLIYNQQLVNSDKTVRLIDLGREKYQEYVPFSINHPHYEEFFDNLNEHNMEHKRIWRDIHSVWQWGITNHDLIERLKRLGFSIKFHKNCGKFSNFKYFEDHAFIFLKE